jgi:hypothetical protein
MDAKLPHAFSNGGPVAQVTESDAVEPHTDLCLRLLVAESVYPLTERRPTIFSEIDLKLPLMSLHAVSVA